jgi:L-aspartate oxidase
MNGKHVEGVEVQRNGRRELYRSARIILATGGAGQIFAMTTNPREARGAGLAMALRAGATIVNPEFMQFHPTALDIGRDPAPLATEALRGEGAWLVDRLGERFMVALHKDAELAPRDVVARGVFASLQAGRGAFLDCRAAIGSRFPELFPTVHAACLEAGIDPVFDPIPVSPAAHYHMGGVEVDQNGRVRGLAGLYAVGEVAHTGVHGANRLASNSLLEAVVFGARVAEAIRMDRSLSATPAQPEALDLGSSSEIEPNVPARILAIRRLMQDACGVLREATRLRAARAELEPMTSGSGPIASFAVVAHLMVEAALAREESRGGHSRFDFPNPWPGPAWTRMSRELGLTLGPPH